MIYGVKYFTKDEMDFFLISKEPEMQLHIAWMVIVICRFKLA